MSISSIITPMNFSLARDAICQLLANERNTQIELATQSGATSEWINNTLDFVIYPKRFRLPDASDMPCVFVYFNEMEFPLESQDIYENYALANLQLDYYAVGKAETGYNTSGQEVLIKTADENAEDRLNYLTAQIYKILCSEGSIKLGTNNLVTRSRIKKWERIITPGENNTAATVLGASFSLELGFNEPTYYAATVDIQDFYTSLKIRDEYIDPFVRVILGEE